MGFDVPREFFKKVRYVERQPAPPETPDLKFMKQLLFTKFAHWHYEQEYRAFVSLDDHEAGLYFMNFSEKLRLCRVIVGDQSTISRADVAGALADMSKDVEVFKARAAFRSFEIVRQGDKSMWA